jgi:hypothetical protein
MQQGGEAMSKGKSASGKSARRTGAGQRAHRSLKEQLILAGKVLVAEGQDDFTRGHISLRLPDDPNLFFMKAHSIRDFQGAPRRQLRHPYASDLFDCAFGNRTRAEML